MGDSRGVILSIGLAGLLAAGCSKPDPAPAPPRSGAEQAAEASGKIAILVKDVRATSFNNGVPTQCTVSYNVLNNSQYHLYKASASMGGIPFDVIELAANSHYADDQNQTLDPTNNSCSGIVDKLVQAQGRAGVTTCSLEGATEGDCQARFASFLVFDASYKIKVQQAENAAAQQYAGEQAKVFEQEKAQAYAERGQYQVAAGAVLVSPNPETGLVVAAVTAPDFDPTKIDDTTPIATSQVALCANTADEDGTAMIPNLYASIVYPDKYGLAAWYRFIGRCNKTRVGVLWVRASTVETMMQGGQLSKLSNSGQTQ